MHKACIIRCQFLDSFHSNQSTSTGATTHYKPKSPLIMGNDFVEAEHIKHKTAVRASRFGPRSLDILAASWSLAVNTEFSRVLLSVCCQQKNAYL